MLDWLPDVIFFIVNYTKKKNLIHYGLNAHNIFINEVNTPSLKPIPVNELRLYSINNDYHVEKLMLLLKKKYPSLKFKTENKFLYWRDHNDHDITISITNVKDQFIKK